MDVMQLWWLSLAIFAVVVVVVAVLLGLIVAAAKSVDRHAEAIWTVGQEIAGNTVSIWMLEGTKAQVEQMADRARSVGRSIATIEERLREVPGAGSRGRAR